MKILIILITLSVLASSGSAHTYLHSIKGSQSCVRQHANPKMNPISVRAIGSKQIMCNAGISPAVSSCGVNAGEKLTLQWFHHGNTADDQIIHESHKGPCSVYLSKADASGNPMGWFRIYGAGYNSQSKKFCTENLMRRHGGNGQLGVKIPAGLENGRYILRAELIGLHQADNRNAGAEFYVGCGDLTITGGNGSLNPATFQIPSAQYMTASSPGLHFNIWNNTAGERYELPGPRIVSGIAGNSNSRQPTSIKSRNNSRQGQVRRLRARSIQKY
ncbi:glycosyl hydrolase family 61-domain-containing protein [Paraphysoderma sedebokerense]|nr:glycosyl hydrolase family 61-domain-containing protein [Paraphysoderma sedebokerense]